jgi:uncharacterized phage infection (PIP) family protein YhgE
MGPAALVAGFTALHPMVKAVGVAFASYELGKLIADWTGLNEQVAKATEWFLKVTGSTETTGAALDKMTAPLAEVARTTGLAITNMEEFKKAVESGQIVFDTVTNTWVKAGNAAVTMGDGTQKAADGTEILNDALATADGTIGGFLTAVNRTGSALDSHADAAKTASGETDTLHDTLAKMAEDDRIRNMEFVMDLQIANIQANAEVAKAAFESLSTTITSTGELLGTLYGLLVDPDSAGYVTQILEQIQKENEAREAAFKAQQDWFTANIDYLTARTERIKSDEALIQIDGAALQPHLEAFMFEILAAIQVRLNEEGLELLTGLDAPVPA